MVALLLAAPAVVPAHAQDAPFVTIWQTDNPGGSNDDQITIPGTGSYEVEWWDVDNVRNNGSLSATDEETITFPDPGTYRVEITGGLTRVNLGDSDDPEKILDVEQWGDIEWESMAQAFEGASNLDISAQDAPDLSGVESMTDMFRGATSLDADLDHWDTGSVVVMMRVFQDAESFNGEIGNWDTSNVGNMIGMFFGAESFNQDIGDWETGEVLGMDGMFWGASSFDQDIGDWDVSEVTLFSNMFRETPFNQDISGWDVSSANSMVGMFKDATSFDQELAEWDPSNAQIMRQMFKGATSFNGDIGGWDTGEVVDVRQMFRGAVAFDQDIGDWDVGEVLSFDEMFLGASSFNQDLGDWQINTAELDAMFDGTALSIENYDATLSGWAAAAPDVEDDVVLGASGLEYCVAEEDREALLQDFGWTITDEGRFCAPGAIVLESPVDGTVDVSVTPALGWDPDERADTYQLVISEHADLSDPVVDRSDLTDAAFEPEEELERDTEHYWRVRGLADEDGNWSETWAFTTAGGAETLVAVSGEDQSARVTSSLDEPLVVRAIDAADEPVEGHAIAFSVAEVPEGAEDHEISQGVQTTDEEGEAETELTLGTASGTYVVEAEADGDLEGSPISFEAEAEPDEAVALERVSGDGQTGAAGEDLGAPFVARVVDEHGNGVEGHSVAFSVSGTPDGASDYDLSDGLVDTDADGEAASTLTLGTEAGDYTVEAEASGDLDGSPVAFTAEAQVELPDVRPVVLEVSDADPEAGDTVEVTVSVENEGDGAAEDVTVPLALPDDRLEVEEAEASHGSFDEDEKVWEVGTLEGGDEATLTLEATVQVPEPEEGS